ncbi:MAG TPA: N-acetylgalactosamine-4-sulfatase [Planctomycetaceae bacterium]|nr:N-acetylgalactosamine-4-sulfatase [Planctomycetaceae bacterium]
MHDKSPRLVYLLCTFLLLGGHSVVFGQVIKDRPNIVLLIADDLGYQELGCQGNTDVPTPHIDALAQSGVRCTQAYVTAPNCSPSRAGLLAGRIPTRFGYEFNPIGARNEDPGTGIPAAEFLLPEFLQRQGYVCGLVGKWHLGGSADFHPHRHGFDRFFGFNHEGHYFEPAPWKDTTLVLRRETLPRSFGTRYQASPRRWYSSHMGHNEPDYDANNPILRDGQPVDEQSYLTDAFTREAVSFIQENRHTPFFLALTYNAVHSPLQAKTSTFEKFSHIEDVHRRIFAAMLSDLDESVGEVVRTLDKLEIRRNTLIVFLSDNGGPTKELTSSNKPLRDGKGSMYEGGLRVPFVVSFPGSLPAGEQCDEVISSLDIYATAASILGQEPISRRGDRQELDGQDMLPVLRGETPSRNDTLYWRQGGRAALRSGDWKIVAPGRNPNDRRWELYNIASDLTESTDLAQENPIVLNRLRGEFESFDETMQEPLFR